MRGRRVGTLTLGISLIGAGILFLVWILAPSTVNIWFCLQFWPVILILLGGEVLCGYIFAKEEKIRYDGWGIVLICCLLMGCFTVASIWSAGHYWMERGILYGDQDGIHFYLND